MNFLALVNGLRVLLREEQVTSAQGTAPDLATERALINRAARRVLGRRAWSFMQRNDGYIFLPASESIPVLSMYTGLNTATANAVSSPGRFCDGSVQAKLVVTGSSTLPDTSFVVTEMITTTGVTTFTQKAVWKGPTEIVSGKVYVNEVAFPSTVAQVLSIRNEEGVAVRFETVDAFDDFDRMFPQDAQRFGDYPEVVAVGGAVDTTRRSSSNPNSVIVSRTGLALRVYPPSDTLTQLRYSYTKRMTDLSADTDTLNIPDEVDQHIIRVAFEEALMSNIEDDSPRGRHVQIQNELDYRELVSWDRRDIGRRHVASVFGATSRQGANYVTRSEIPEP